MQSATLTRLSSGSIPLARGRLRRPLPWARAAFAVMCLAALVGYFAFPTYPTYDSFYALLWGRDLLHLHLPDFRVYRGPTEHPLAIAFGVLCSLFGQGGARLMVLGSIGSFVAVVAGLYRLGRVCFGPLVGVLAGVLVLSRFFVESLAAQGYLDISYIALIVWAIVLEMQRPRRGVPVLLLLAAAGLLRPDAWVLSGVYWLWCVSRPRGQQALPSGACRRAAQEHPPASPAAPPRPPASQRARRPRLHIGWQAGYLALALSAPLIWVLVDVAVTGDPTYSLNSTAGLAQELGRTQGLGNVLASLGTFTVRIDKLPVVIGGLAGIPLAIWLTPKRVPGPLAALALLVVIFVLEGFGGASVIDRYLLGASTVLLLFCAVSLGGWAMLQRGTLMRRAWMAAAAALLAYGVGSAATTLNLTSLRNTLAYHEEFHRGLAAALHDPAVKAQLYRCPLVSLPNNKLIPDARWILDSVGQHDIVARSQARADVAKRSHTLEDRILAGSVAVYPLGAAVFYEAIVDVGDDPRDQVPLPGFARVYTSRYYAVYANC